MNLDPGQYRQVRRLFWMVFVLGVAVGFGAGYLMGALT